MLCTLEILKTYIGIDSEDFDEKLTLLIKMVSAQIENYLGYPVARAVNVGEVHSVNNEQLLLLDCQPIQSVENVKIGGVEIDDYKLIPKYSKVGMLYRGIGWCGDYYTRGMTYDVVSGVYEIEIDYTSGWYLPGDEGYTEGSADSLPFDILSACLVACSELWTLKQNNAEGIKAYSEGGISTTFADGGSMADCGLSDKVCSMLVDYRRQAIA